MKIRKVTGMQLGEITLETLKKHCGGLECIQCCFYNMHLAKCHFELRPCSWNTETLVEIEGGDKR